MVQNERLLDMPMTKIHPLLKWLAVLLLLLAVSNVYANTQLTALRTSTTAEKSRLVFDLTGPVTFKDFTLSNPDRFVVDIPKAQLATHLTPTLLAKTPVKDIRHSFRHNTLRLVFDLNHAVTSKSMLLKPHGSAGYRLVFDLFPAPKKAQQQLDQPIAQLTQTIASAAAKIPPTTAKSSQAVQPELKATAPYNLTTAPKSTPGRDIVVIIDPGHGGKDPGASGPGRIKEKNVVLAIAKDLQRIINQQPGFKAYLTRRGDYFLTLRQRLNVARKHKGDVFIAIHADAFKNTRANGASVFALSERGATSEAARWLANNENKSELMGGVSLSDKSSLLRSVLLNLSQTATISSSIALGQDVKRQLGQVTRLHQRRVEQAAFVVLKSPDIPSILIETGFISNPQEARQLNNKAYQRKLAFAIMQGVKQYFTDNPPRGTWLAQQRWKRYTVARGDSLASIANRYNVSVNQLKRNNNLASNHLRVGQTLTIPG